MESTPPSLFDRGPTPVVRLVFFTVAAIVLMTLDARFRYAEVIRQGFALAVYPIQRAALAPIALFESASDYFVAQAKLMRETTQLREERLRDAKDLITLGALQAENEKLRQLLDSRERSGRTAQFAEIMYLGRDPFSRKVIIDKGTQHGIEAGQPVIDVNGLIGQVTRVHSLVSEVTLVIDKDHAIPVQVVRSGLRGVVFGSSDGVTMELRFTAGNADIQVGDVLVTSGLDGVYPPSLPVASVVRIDNDATSAFARITCAPLGGPGQNRELLILSKTEASPPYPADAPTAKRPPRGGRSKGR
ncbi:MAG: rod shape-determining protein MreC [Betaproteobacteria bacterium]|nr:rod shape-determining protein MreC [Betaproteobacteria bacterium]